VETWSAGVAGMADYSARAIAPGATRCSWKAYNYGLQESTARALRTLRELGLIQTHRMRLIVLDLKRLRSHAGQS
jgi:hypothetical protein